MPRLPPRLRSLERRLLALPDDGEPMLVSELDGFLAGLLICPDLVMPGQWLPLVWGQTGSEDDAAAFTDMAELQALLDDVMAHYNALATAFSQGTKRYTPILEDDPRTQEILWEIWAAGFGRAVDLRPASWTAIAESGDEEAQTALAGLLDLVAISRNDSSLPETEINTLTLKAPDLIPKWVEALNAWRIAHVKGKAAPPVHTFGKVGRNDPCPAAPARNTRNAAVSTDQHIGRSS